MQKKVVVNGVAETPFEITRHHFGGNIIGTFHTEDGWTNDHFREAIDGLDILDLRYPAGEPDNIYSTGMLIDGELPSHVTNFFASISDRPGQVMMVVPTFDSYTGPEELEVFATKVLEQYGSKVRGFEVGNEMWGFQTETEYGRIANEQVKVLDAAMEATGQSAKILVQMANAGGAKSEFKNVDDLSWKDRTIEANKTIIAQLDNETLQKIDALVEHVYNRDKGQVLGDEIASTNMAWLDIKTWREVTGIDYEVAITEWNIRTTNEEQLGVKAGSTLIHHLDNLVVINAVEMHVWPPQHNTKTDLAGETQVVFDDETGFVKNTVTGGMYDMMSSSLPGKTLLDIETEGQIGNLSIHGYANASEAVFFVASRSEVVEEISFSLGEVLPGAALESAIKLGYDASEESSDGKHFSQSEGGFVESDWVLIDGERYYLNEHDVNASFTKLDVAEIDAPFGLEFTLRPYEVVQLTYTITPPQGQFTDSHDEFAFGEADEFIFAFGGDDTVHSGAGNDTVDGGDGNDHLVLGLGDDHGAGQGGDDFLSGWGGDDSLYGGEGSDTLYGFAGSDSLVGGTGNDRIAGGKQNDTVGGGSGDDVIFGNEGHDALFGNAGQDIFSGDAGDDTVHGGDGADHLAGQEGSDVLLGGAGHDLVSGGLDSDRLRGDGGHDTLIGGEGTDTLLGGSGNDRLLGGSGSDQLIGGTGNDTLIDGEGDDLLSAEEGDDFIFLSGGSDTVSFGSGDGHDTIAGFDADHDTIEFHGGIDPITGEPENPVPLFRKDGDDLVIKTSPDSSIRLEDVASRTNDLEELLG